MEVMAAVARGASKALELQKVSIASLRPDEVLVRIVGVGLCHSDVAARDQQLPFPFPAVLGHEGAGFVEAVGQGVTKVQPGDRVVLTFRSCGSCPACVRGAPAHCAQFGPLNLGGHRVDGSTCLHHGDEPLASNFFGQSSFAEKAVAYERNVIKIGDDVPLELMGPLGCGVQTGAGAILNSLDCRSGSSLLILGAGSVGLSAMLAAVVRGCSTIIVVEPSAERRALALELGATHALAPGNMPETVRGIIASGVDYAFDTTGRSDVVEAALACLTIGGTLGLVAVPADPAATISYSLTAAPAFNLKGVIEGDSDPDLFIPHLVDLYRSGKFPFDRLIRTYPLHEINQAITDQLEGRTIKPVLLVGPAA